MPKTKKSTKIQVPAIDEKLLNRLLGYLQAKIMFHPERPEILNCTHDLRLSRYFFEMEGLNKKEIERYFTILKDKGGNCDCEVLLNAAGKIK